MQAVDGEEQERLGGRVAQDMDAGGLQAGGGSQPDAHVHIPDLGDGGPGDDPLDVLLADRTQGTGDHADDAEEQEHVADVRGDDGFQAEHPPEKLDQQEDVAFTDQGGQDRRGRRGGRTVGIRHPGVEGPERALDREAAAHEREHDGERQHPGAAFPQARDRLPDGPGLFSCILFAFYLF